MMMQAAEHASKYRSKFFDDRKVMDCGPASSIRAAVVTMTFPSPTKVPETTCAICSKDKRKFFMGDERRTMTPYGATVC